MNRRWIKKSADRGRIRSHLNDFLPLSTNFYARLRPHFTIGPSGRAARQERAGTDPGEQELGSIYAKPNPITENAPGGGMSG
ncbi:hypothetical protein, partial [Aeromonas salmonicida]|uniref:hypothetical protein n=1 Tax=Aeromonas salmonicida TaxID=645 RepID=UPI0019D692D9